MARSTYNMWQNLPFIKEEKTNTKAKYPNAMLKAEYPLARGQEPIGDTIPAW